MRTEKNSYKSDNEKKPFQILELIVMFIALPILYLFDYLPGMIKAVPLLLFFSYCLIYLIKNKAFASTDWSFEKVTRLDWVRLASIPFVFYTMLFVLFHNYLLANFSDPKVLIAVISYPLLSSLPQEIIYRKFFYARYEHLFRNQTLLVITNSLLFSFAHIYFENYIALILTFLGGLLFSSTYLRTKSLLFVSIEHSIYGLALLSSGMNEYFYKAF